MMAIPHGPIHTLDTSPNAYGKTKHGQ